MKRDKVKFIVMQKFVSLNAVDVFARFTEMLRDPNTRLQPLNAHVQRHKVILF